MQITTLIIDDDIDSRSLLRAYLEKNHPAISICGEAGSVKETKRMIDKNRPDLLLLDIELPDGNGISMLEKAAQRNFEVIFITAFDKYAIKAFRQAALDYLLKPFSNTELDGALKRVESRIGEKYFAKHWEILQHNSKQENSNTGKLAIPTAEGFLFTDLKDIVRLESHSNYTHLYFTSKEKIVSSRTLGYYDDILPPDVFIRIHHSHIINTAYIEKYVRGGVGGTIVMKYGIELPVSQRKKEEVFRQLINNTK